MKVMPAIALVTVLIMGGMGVVRAQPAPLERGLPKQFAAASEQSDGPAIPDEGGAAVEIRLFSYSPALRDVSVGTAVTWFNRDAIEHSVTHGSSGQPGQVFDSGPFTLDDHFAFVFLEPGAYTYFCTRHPHMEGVVQVHPPEGQRVPPTDIVMDDRFPG